MDLSKIVEISTLAVVVAGGLVALAIKVLKRIEDPAVSGEKADKAIEVLEKADDVIEQVEHLLDRKDEEAK